MDIKAYIQETRHRPLTEVVAPFQRGEHPEIDALMDVIDIMRENAAREDACLVLALEAVQASGKTGLDALDVAMSALCEHVQQADILTYEDMCCRNGAARQVSALLVQCVIDAVVDDVTRALREDVAAGKIRVVDADGFVATARSDVRQQTAVKAETIHNRLYRACTVVLRRIDAQTYGP